MQRREYPVRISLEKDHPTLETPITWQELGKILANLGKSQQLIKVVMLHFVLPTSDAGFPTKRAQRSIEGYNFRGMACIGNIKNHLVSIAHPAKPRPCCPSRAVIEAIQRYSANAAWVLLMLRYSNSATILGSLAGV
jgi:hypothetical protein